MEKYILFGAGQYAIKVIHFLGRDKVELIVDNAPAKWGTNLEGISIYGPEEKKELLKSYQVIISVSLKYQQQIMMQLSQMNVKNAKTLKEIQTEITKKKIKSRTDYIKSYNKAIRWIIDNTLEGQAIICNTDKRKCYPEVTGYYIPTLLRWGYRDLAFSYAKWLCSIQKDDGSWYDTDDITSYIFDTAQIIKGLIEIRDLYPKVENHIIKGCNWILSNMGQCGRLASSTIEIWGDKKVCSEVIHLYCLSPLVKAGEILNKPFYKESAYKILDYYKTNHYDEIMNFGMLSHFYAYVMEALLDMGEDEIVKEAMDRVGKLQKGNGAVPAYHNVDWVCSTGLFQFALVWFRLGEIEKGNRAFNYACKLQNESGGWYGSYLSEENPNEDNNYFPTAEISWAVKYFLDALYYKNIAEFNLLSDSFQEKIDKKDGRYRIIRENVYIESTSRNMILKILDVGCGKGRYLKNLIEDEPEHSYFAVDLSEAVMKYITIDQVYKKQGILTNIPYPDHYFDITYTCEALEHAIDIKSAIKELARVTKPGGKIIVIDKNKTELGRLKIGECEIWFDAEHLKSLMQIYCSNVEIIHTVDYNGKKEDNLFLAWIGTIVEEG